jgi:hypothetical protein
MLDKCLVKCSRKQLDDEGRLDLTKKRNEHIAPRLAFVID